MNLVVEVRLSCKKTTRPMLSSVSRDKWVQRNLVLMKGENKGATATMKQVNAEQ